MGLLKPEEVTMDGMMDWYNSTNLQPRIYFSILMGFLAGIAFMMVVEFAVGIDTIVFVILHWIWDKTVGAFTEWLQTLV